MAYSFFFSFFFFVLHFFLCLIFFSPPIFVEHVIASFALGAAFQNRTLYKREACPSTLADTEEALPFVRCSLHGVTLFMR
jgi:hypothetical protein